MALDFFSQVFCFLIIVNVVICCVSSLTPLQLDDQTQSTQIQNIRRSNVFPPTRARLPTQIIPIHYHVDLIPILDPSDPDFLTAPGRVTITINCVEATRLITLHSLEIEINDGDVTVMDMLEIQIPVSGQSFDLESETFSIELSAPLIEGGNYVLEIAFVARVANDRQDGLYLSSYLDPQTGKTNYQAATQFQAIAARKAFPCFDEPALKATFAFRLGRKEVGFQSLWNMDKTDTIPIEGREGYVWDVYPMTATKMSTYILAIVASDFESDTASEELYRKPVRTWGPTTLMQSSDHGVFASETAAKVLSFYEAYLDYEYDFPKMDSVAVPVFEAGAMENWGLNLYQTYYLLLTDGESTVLDKWRIVSVICHELAHQWWGNLVTLRWWNDIWLNEAFANYMQFIAANGTVPEFESMERVNIDTTHSGFEYDAGSNSVPVHNLEEENVDIGPGQIIAQKGAALIRMMNSFLTQNTLLQGLRNYLKGMAYKDAHQDDLFQFLTTQAHADGTLAPEMTVKQIMDTWTLQAGFPLIRVSRAGPSSASVTQERFVATPLLRRVQDEGWHVPIGYTTKSQPQVNDQSLAPKFWIVNNSTGTEFPAADINEWILLNPNAQCFYRVLYDDYFATLLKLQLAEDPLLIPALSRAQLVDDYFKSAEAQYISIKEAMDFTFFLENEHDLPVWTTAFNNLRKLLTILTDTSFANDFNAYILTLVHTPLLTVGAEPTGTNESPVTALLRTQLLDWACALGHDLCYSTASKLLTAWMEDPTVNPIVTDLQPMIYCAAVAQETNPDLWDFLVAAYSNPGASTRQQTLLLNALACTRSSDRLNDLIGMAGAGNSDIKPAHAIPLLQRIAMNQDGRPIILNYITNNVESILTNPRLLEGAIKSVTSTLGNYFSTAEAEAEMEKYLLDNTALFSDDLKTSLRTTTEKIKSNTNWLKLHGPGLTEFFGNLTSAFKPKFTLI